LPVGEKSGREADCGGKDEDNDCGSKQERT
jgi:hypothetical protein